MDRSLAQTPAACFVGTSGGAMTQMSGNLAGHGSCPFARRVCVCKSFQGSRSAKWADMHDMTKVDGVRKLFQLFFSL